MRPDLGSLILKAGDLGLAITLFTNGRAVRRDVLKSLRDVSGLLAVSLDGPNAAIHETLRGKHTFIAAYTGFAEGLSYLGTNKVMLSCVLSRSLLPCIDELWDFARQHCVGTLYIGLFEPLRGQVRSPQSPYSREMITPVLRLLEKAEQNERPRLIFSESDDLIQAKTVFTDRDIKKILGRTIKLQADGWALPGPFFYDDCFRLGRPAEQGWAAILSSAVYSRLRELAVTRRQMIGECNSCFWCHRCGGGSLALTWANYGRWMTTCPMCELYQATLDRAAKREIRYESSLLT